MTENELKTLLKMVTPPDEAARAAAHAHWAALAKPLGGLGQLETMVEDAAALTGTETPDLANRAVLVLCADNGVVAQGVSQTDASVTRAVLENLAARRTSVCRMAAAAHCAVVPVDMGIAGAPVDGAINCRVAPGTADFTQGPAMSRAQAAQAIACGIELVREQKRQGVQMLATGEMGIGNTTTSSAVLSALLGLPAAETVSRGGGVNDEGFLRKKEIIDRAIERYRPDPSDPVDVLSKVGGFDLCGMTGAFLAAAYHRIPVVIDGFISVVAALCAAKMQPESVCAMIPSHASMERGYSRAMDALGLKPMLLLDMRLGEGSGCPIAFEIVSAAMDVLENMATFAEAAIDDGYLQEIRDNERFQS